MKRGAVLTVIILVAAALSAAAAWFWQVRMDPGELLAAIQRDGAYVPTLTDVSVQHYESGVSEASANIRLTYQFEDVEERIQADLRLERIGQRWRVVHVYSGRRQYDSLASLGRDVTLHLVSEHTVEQAGDMLEQAGRSMEDLGEAARDMGTRVIDMISRDKPQVDDDG